MEIILGIITSVVLSVIGSIIAVKKDLRIIKETKLRDRYWDYIEALVSTTKNMTSLERQTYNVCLFAKNKEIVSKAKILLHQKNITEQEIEELINLMRKDLGL